MADLKRDDTFLTIHRGNATSSQSLPLVLIHDGGGTIMNYFKLGQMGRAVHGIYDPLFQRSIPWSGGIPEMAETYAKLVQKHLPGERILLGGWSLGGLIAFEMSKILSAQGVTHVSALLMIESLNPQSKYPKLDRTWEDRDLMLSNLQPRSRDVLQRSLDDALRMIDNWSPAGKDDSDNTFIPPPAVLLRAKEDQDSRGDWSDEMGWELFPNAFVKAVYDVPGRHFTIFDPLNIEKLQESIKEACQVLECHSAR